MNLLTRGPVTVAVHLTPTGTAPVSIAECEIVEFPGHCLGTVMRDSLTAHLGVSPNICQVYLHREKRLLFVAVLTQFVNRYEPMQFFQIPPSRVEQALLNFDEATQRRWLALVTPEVATEAPAGAPSREHESKPHEAAPERQPEGEPHEGDRIDYAAVVSTLRKAGKRVQAALVEYMVDKKEATAEDIAEHVHKDSNTTEKAMRANANKTTASLEDMGIPVRFRLASGRMFRDISPE